MKIRIPKDLKLPPIPVGWYQAAWTESNHKDSKAGNPMIEAKFMISTAGPTEVETVGRKVMTRLVFTENALWFVNMLYEAVTGNELPVGEEMEIDVLKDLVQSQCMNVTMLINVGTQKSTTEGDSREFPTIEAFKAL